MSSCRIQAGSTVTLLRRGYDAQSIGCHLEIIPGERDDYPRDRPEQQHHVREPRVDEVMIDEPRRKQSDERGREAQREISLDAR